MHHYSHYRTAPLSAFLPNLGLFILDLTSVFPQLASHRSEYLRVLKTINPALFEMVFGQNPILSPDNIDQHHEALLKYFCQLWPNIHGYTNQLQATPYCLNWPIRITQSREVREFNSSATGPFQLEITVTDSAVYFFYPKEATLNALLEGRLFCSQCSHELQQQYDCHRNCRVCSVCWVLSLQSQPSSCPGCQTELTVQELQSILLALGICEKCRVARVNPQQAVLGLCESCRTIPRRMTAPQHENIERMTHLPKMNSVKSLKRTSQPKVECKQCQKKRTVACPRCEVCRQCVCYILYWFKNEETREEPAFRCECNYIYSSELLNEMMRPGLPHGHCSQCDGSVYVKLLLAVKFSKKAMSKLVCLDCIPHLKNSITSITQPKICADRRSLVHCCGDPKNNSYTLCPNGHIIHRYHSRCPCC